MATVKTVLNDKAIGTEGRADQAVARKGLKFERRFTDGKTSPFDMVEWEKRTALIGNEKGVTIFRQEGVEVPKNWSQTATSPSDCCTVFKSLRGGSANLSRISCRLRSRSASWACL